MCYRSTLPNLLVEVVVVVSPEVLSSMMLVRSNTPFDILTSEDQDGDPDLVNFLTGGVEILLNNGKFQSVDSFSLYSRCLCSSKGIGWSPRWSRVRHGRR